MRILPPLIALGLSACITTPPLKPKPPEVKPEQKPNVLLHLGDDVARDGDQASAISLYRTAAKTNPSDPEPLVHLGEAFTAANDADRAEQAFRGALALDKDRRDARFGLAIALIAQRRLGEALPVLQAMDNGKPDPRLLRAEGTALAMLGRAAEAQAVFRRGLAAAPTDATLHGDLALSLALSHDEAGALAEMRAAVAAPQPDPREDANAVLVLGLLGHDDEARQRGAKTIGSDATQTLLARVDAARHAANAGEEAAALGVLTSGSPSAPPARTGLLPAPENTMPVTAPAPASAPAPAADYSPTNSARLAAPSPTGPTPTPSQTHPGMPAGNPAP